MYPYYITHGVCCQRVGVTFFKKNLKIYIYRRKNMKEFAKILDVLLSTKNISQSELARRINVKQQTISRYCKGTATPTLETFWRICLAIEVEPNVLLGWNLEDLKSWGGNLVKELTRGGGGY